MSVVSSDWRDPAPWMKPGVVYGVVRDGEVLRFCRRSKTGKKQEVACSVEEWVSGWDSEFVKRFSKERQTGAVLAVGLEPHRVMLRKLVSPFKDQVKSGEIWGALLDAAIPFPLERCQVVFLPSPPKEDGTLCCLAVAARTQDVEEVLQEWRDLNLMPDLVFPEELLLPAGGNSLWLGETRTVFATWEEGGFAGGGGALQPGQRDKVLSRFEQSRPDAGRVDWSSFGPRGEEQPGVLESSLTDACSKGGALHANLLAGAFASEKLEHLYGKRLKTLKVCLLLLLVLLVMFPLSLRLRLLSGQRELRRQISAEFESFTGMPNNASGQELLVAGRYLEEARGPLWKTVRDLEAPGTSLLLMELMKTAGDSGLVILQLNAGRKDVELHVLGSESEVDRMREALEISGWTVTRSAGEDGSWKISGRRGE